MLRESARLGAICERNLPSFSPNRRWGPIIARVLASRFGMFTALRMVPSNRTARMDCAISMPTLSCASAVDAPRCGVRTRLGALRNGESTWSGSTSKTSRAAPATCASCSALSSAASSTRPPRAQMMMRTPRFVFLQSRFIENVASFCGERRMQRNEIRAREQIVELVHQLDLQAAGAGCGKVWIIGDDAHPESNGPPAQLAADPAHSDNAKRFVVELDAFEILFVPFVSANVCVGFRNLAR